MNKLSKIYFLISKTRFVRVLYYWLRLKYPRNSSFHIYPFGTVKIHKSAKLILKNGVFSINILWCNRCRAKFKSELILSENSEAIIENDFGLYQGASIYVAPNAKILIKGNGFANTNTQINCFDYVEIGCGTYISDDVRIQDSDNHSIIENGNVKTNTAPIIIGDHVWIGKNAIILKGVTIGAGSVVAAGSVVVKNVPAHSLVAGNPARVIKDFIEWR